MREFSGGELNFSKSDTLEAWLIAQPHETSVVIAARAGLRVAPTLSHWAGRVDERRFAHLVFATLWANASAGAAAKYPTRTSEFRSASAATAAESAATNAAAVVNAAAAASNAAMAGAFLVTVADRAAAAASPGADAADARAAANAAAVLCFYARDAADEAAKAAHAPADMWAAISADANRLKTVSPDVLAREPLWPEGAPNWAQDVWRDLQTVLNQPHWQPWLDWYGRRLDGLKAEEDIELLLATFPKDPRKKDPAEQNTALMAEIARLGQSGTGDHSDTSLPALPSPGAGPKVAVVDEKFDAVCARQEDEGPQSQRSENLLTELRETIADFVNSFDAKSNAHGQLRKIASRYQRQVDLEAPSVDLLFALGLRLENAARAARREILSRCEPTLEDEQEEALNSVLNIHGVFIAADPEGVRLLEAAARYPYKPSDDEAFKSQAEPVATAVGKTPDFATERLSELLEQLVAQIGEGEHPERSGLIGRNMVQTMLITIAKAAITGAVGTVAGQIAIHTQAGQYVIAARCGDLR